MAALPSSVDSVVLKSQRRRKRRSGSLVGVLTPCSRRDTLVLNHGPGVALYNSTPSSSAAGVKQNKPRYSSPLVGNTKSSASKSAQAIGSSSASPLRLSRSSSPASFDSAHHTKYNKENIASPSWQSSPRSRHRQRESSTLSSASASSLELAPALSPKVSASPSKLQAFQQHSTSTVGSTTSSLDAQEWTDESLNNAVSFAFAPTQLMSSFVAPGNIMPRERLIPVGAIGYDSDELTDADAEGSFEDDWEDERDSFEPNNLDNPSTLEDIQGSMLGLSLVADANDSTEEEDDAVDSGADTELESNADTNYAEHQATDSNDGRAMNTQQTTDSASSSFLLESALSLEHEPSSMEEIMQDCRNIDEDDADSTCNDTSWIQDQSMRAGTPEIKQYFNELDEPEFRQLEDETISNVSVESNDPRGVQDDEMTALRQVNPLADVVTKPVELSSKLIEAEQANVAPGQEQEQEQEQEQGKKQDQNELTVSTQAIQEIVLSAVEQEKDSEAVDENDRVRGAEANHATVDGEVRLFTINQTSTLFSPPPRELQELPARAQSIFESPQCKSQQEVPSEAPPQALISPLRRSSPRKVFATPTQNSPLARPSTMTMSQRRSPRRLQVTALEAPASVLAAPTAKRQLTKLASMPVFAARPHTIGPALSTSALPAVPRAQATATGSKPVSRIMGTAKLPSSMSTVARTRLPAAGPPTASSKLPFSARPVPSLKTPASTVARPISTLTATASSTAATATRPPAQTRPIVPTLGSRLTTTKTSTLTRPTTTKTEPFKPVAGTRPPFRSGKAPMAASTLVRKGISKPGLPSVLSKAGPGQRPDMPLKRAPLPTISGKKALAPSRPIPKTELSKPSPAVAAQSPNVDDAEAAASDISIAVEAFPVIRDASSSPAVITSVALPLLPRPAPVVVPRSPDKRSAQRSNTSVEATVAVIENTASAPLLAPAPALLPRPAPIERPPSAEIAPASASVALVASPSLPRPITPPRALLPRPAPLDTVKISSVLTAPADKVGSIENPDIFASQSVNNMTLTMQPSSGVAALRAARLKRSRGVTTIDADSSSADLVPPTHVSLPLQELLPRPTRSPRSTRRSRILSKEESTTSSDGMTAVSEAESTISSGTDSLSHSNEVIVPTREPFILRPPPALTQEELTRLTQKNTKRNQVSINKLQVETIIMDCNRPPSPTSKIRRSLGNEGALGKPTTKEGREARAAKRRNALRSSTDGSEAALVGSELGQEGLTVIIEEPKSHFRAAGDEEEFVSPIRTNKSHKSSSLSKKKSVTNGEVESKSVKTVKWDRALVYEAGRGPAVKPSQEGIIKRLVLDSFGNVAVPTNTTVTKPIAVQIKKLVYKDDE
ncbi:hypothetical protein OIO90_000305 [Microbotryomycetes sp. JL221]|nr:hypothetical protein OIO90_000305 [Microbotryomycetes sp. JL221]